MESENNKEFDRQIKAKLDRHQPEVPASLWKAIQKELPQEEKVRNISGNRRFPYSWVAIAACLLIAFSFWKLKPEEVIYLRSPSAIADKADKPDSESVGNPVAPAPAITSAPTVSYATRSKATVDARFEKSGTDRLSDVPLNSYAASHRTGSVTRQSQPEIHEQLEPVEIPESDPVAEPEVQNVLEEEVAFVPAPIEEAIASNPPEPDASALSAEERSRPKVVSSVLNFIAGNIQIGGGGTRVEFSENEHGVLKVDIKGFFNKNNQGL